MILRAARLLACAVVVAFAVSLVSAARAATQQWMDYFQPTPIISPLSSTCWGAAQVGPRDQSNGLEDKALTTWDYWDGGIIKDETTGSYDMFASRWSKSRGHNGWMSDSRCVHATSTNLYGPYTDQGQCFTDNGGMCHNVNALKLREGDTCGKKLAITCSGSVGGSGRVYGADSLDGPWTYIGDLKLDLNGYSGRFSSGDNFRTILRPDGQYECINSRIGLADNVLGPYKAQMAQDFTSSVPGSPTTNMEDPYLFYSGNQYHVFYNCWSEKKAYFYSSGDGIHDWKLEKGYAYDPTSNMVRYMDGTVNHWALLERPSVYIENGHAVAMTFAAINSPKDQDTATSRNGSKVIVVPCDGASFDSGGPPGSAVGTGGAGGGVDAGLGSGGKGGSTGGGLGGSTARGGGGAAGGLGAGGGAGGSRAGGTTLLVGTGGSTPGTGGSREGTGGKGSGGSGAGGSGAGGTGSGGVGSGGTGSGGTGAGGNSQRATGGSTSNAASGCSCHLGQTIATQPGRAWLLALLALVGVRRRPKVNGTGVESTNVRAMHKRGKP